MFFVLQILLVLQYNCYVMVSSHPKFVNKAHFSTETFPEVIAFCDRDNSTHVKTPTDERYEYLLNGKLVYTLKHSGELWELVESENQKIIRVSMGKSLGLALLQGLRFSSADTGKQEERVNILFPVNRRDSEKTTAFMYYYGGYPGNFLESTAELEVIAERFIDPNSIFFSYSYIPVTYLQWLREELQRIEILSGEGTGTLWVYKK